MSTPTTPQNQQPIFTVENLNRIEEELEKDGEFIEIKRLDGELHRMRNPCRGTAGVDVPRGERLICNYIGFGRERERDCFKAAGWEEGLYVPMRVHPFTKWGPMYSEEDTEGRMQSAIIDWERSEQCRHLIRTLQSVRLPEIDKIIAFGGGSITTNISDYLQEHAMFLTVARVVRQRARDKSIPLYVQEPAYTSVDKVVLSGLGFKIIDCFGTRGLTMIDDKTLVMCNFAAFAIRQVVADLGVRPAAMYWRPEVSQLEFNSLSHERQEAYHDVDTDKTRVMMTGYQRVDVPGSSMSRMSFYDLDFPGTREVFMASTWYIRRV
ncbi:hypothetical protein F5Y13DRAFT_51692 [Hypoxylon sp. FL1857]|nr:hypothetical protein F5Y13DRAFT_51692 [Hypoxylon sp. FL1857]